MELEQALKLLKAEKLYAEEIKTVKKSGIVEGREVKDVGDSQLITLTIAGTKYSAFSNAISNDVSERLGHIKVGDEVEAEVVEKAGKNKFGKEITYRNIVDVMRVDRTDKLAVQPGGQTEAVDTKIRSMCCSYSHDLVVAGKIQLDEWRIWAGYFEEYILGRESVQTESETIPF